jgi:hypothetical protein
MRWLRAVVPAALIGWRLVRTRDPRMAPLRAALLALLVLGVVNEARIYGNRGNAQLRVLHAPHKDCIACLSALEADGRVLFAGAARQAYGDGQVAYLPVLTGKEMIALDYFHFPDDWTHKPFPPPPFCEEDATLFRYMELYNVTHVVACEKDWVDRLLADRSHYLELKRFHYPYGREGHDVHLFQVRRAPSFLLEGEGHVTARCNRIDVTLSEPRDTVVLKYHWSDGFSADEVVDLFSVECDEGILFIGVKTNGRTEFTLSYVGAR